MALKYCWNSWKVKEWTAFDRIQLISVTSVVDVCEGKSE
jgi:hypothetical protein